MKEMKYFMNLNIFFLMFMFFIIISFVFLLCFTVVVVVVVYLGYEMKKKNNCYCHNWNNIAEFLHWRNKKRSQKTFSKKKIEILLEEKLPIQQKWFDHLNHIIHFISFPIKKKKKKTQVKKFLSLPVCYLLIIQIHPNINWFIRSLNIIFFFFFFCFFLDCLTINIWKRLFMAKLDR